MYPGHSESSQHASLAKVKAPCGATGKALCAKCWLVDAKHESSEFPAASVKPNNLYFGGIVVNRIFNFVCFGLGQILWPVLV